MNSLPHRQPPLPPDESVVAWRCQECGYWYSEYPAPSEGHPPCTVDWRAARNPSILGPNGHRDLNELVRTLDATYDHYFEHSDGYEKRGAGGVTVYLGDYDTRRNGDPTVTVEVSSAVFGTTRHNYFDSIEAALRAVKSWHRDELAHDYTKDPWG